MSVRPVRLVQRIYLSRIDGTLPGELEVSDPFASDRKADADGVIRWPFSPGIYRIEGAGPNGEPCIGKIEVKDQIEELGVNNVNIEWQILPRWIR